MALQNSTILSILLCAAVVNSIGTLVYRIFFHPLAQTPGPFLAKVSSLYSYWYNFRNARFYPKVQKLHEKYATAKKICNVGSKYPKEVNFYHAIGVEKSTFATTNPAEHRIKRAVPNQFFSRRKVLSLKGIVQQKADKVISRLQAALDSTGEGVDLHDPFRTVSVDVITDYAFDNSYEFLDQERVGREFFDVFRGLGPATLFFQAVPGLRRLALSVPLWLGMLVNEHLESMMAHRQGALRQILPVKGAIGKGEKSLRTIFHQLLQPNATEGYVIPPVDELADKTYLILGATADTTVNAMYWQLQCRDQPWNLSAVD